MNLQALYPRVTAQLDRGPDFVDRDCQGGPRLYRAVGPLRGEPYSTDKALLTPGRFGYGHEQMKALLFGRTR